MLILNMLRVGELIWNLKRNMGSKFGMHISNKLRMLCIILRSIIKRWLKKSRISTKNVDFHKCKNMTHSTDCIKRYMVYTLRI